MLRVVLILLLASPAWAQTVIIDHTNLDAQFDGIAASGYQDDAEALRVMFADRSVGDNLNSGVQQCLTVVYASSSSSGCRRYLHPTMSEFDNVPETWSGTYDASNWVWRGWKGLGLSPEIVCDEGVGSAEQKMRNCFSDFVADNLDNYDAFGLFPSYVDMPIGGASEAAALISMYTTLQSTYPTKTFYFFTSSLHKRTDANFAAFNDAIRAHVIANGGYLLDIADIISHTQSGDPCYDEADGFLYLGTNGYEVPDIVAQPNGVPDDDVDNLAVCNQYAPEAGGGHLGNPQTGRIRIAKGLWALMTRVAGWDGNEEEEPDPPPAGIPARLPRRPE